MNTTENAETLVLMASLVTVNTKHVFSDEELLQKSSQIAHLINDINHEEEEKKAIGSQYKNKIDQLKSEAKLVSGHITNGFAFIDKSAERYLDYETNQRIYKSKDTGEIIKTEPFHASDYQKKLDFDNEEAARQDQIEENNATGGFANGELDALDNVIVDKKIGKVKKEKPTPKDNLDFNYGKDQEIESDDPFADLEN
ncbi:MAG: hypothetical protein JWQ09_5800 [Segetibacter sp.]|nr:hypothetical protein [Segetibacter sp.]